MKCVDIIFNTWVPNPYPMSKKEIEFKTKKWEWLQSTCKLNSDGYCRYFTEKGNYFNVSCEMKNCKAINIHPKNKEVK